MRVLLLTNNVGRVFDAGDDGVEWWLSSLEHAVASADFVCMHLQELEYEEVGDELVQDVLRTRQLVEIILAVLDAHFNRDLKAKARLKLVY